MRSTGVIRVAFLANHCLICFGIRADSNTIGKWGYLLPACLRSCLLGCLPAAACLLAGLPAWLLARLLAFLIACLLACHPFPWGLYQLGTNSCRADATLAHLLGFLIKKMEA